jgi:23S rRNA U2552 (ribose-2'-O)-methylase RlmE/FtsJ
MYAKAHDVPWNKLKLYKRIRYNTEYNLDSNIGNHIQSEQEKCIQEYRNRINVYEQQLKDGKNWEYYKKIVNPYELVYTQKKYMDFPNSLCILYPLSRSYFKMIEMLDIFNIFNMLDSNQIRTGHVCEGPGGFIEAIHENTYKNKKNVQSSIAMTLRSKQKNIPGWKNATHFLQKHRNIKIIYGEDDTGNILLPENQESFINNASNKVHIFTADGGFDFSIDYTKQEEMIFPLLVASTRIAFETMKKGGVFILKVFDFYQKYTTDLLYFLSGFFNEWTLYKPATSRPCNPEQYFVGRGFIGCDENTSDILRLWCNILYNKPMYSLITTEYADDFSKIINTIKDDSFKIQTEYLEKVFYLIEKQDESLIKQYLKSNEKSSYDWCMRFKVPIYSYRYRLFEASHSDQPVSCQ